MRRLPEVVPAERDELGQRHSVQAFSRPGCECLSVCIAPLLLKLDTEVRGEVANQRDQTGRSFDVVAKKLVNNLSHFETLYLVA